MQNANALLRLFNLSQHSSAINISRTDIFILVLYVDNVKENTQFS